MKEAWKDSVRPEMVTASCDDGSMKCCFKFANRY